MVQRVGTAGPIAGSGHGRDEKDWRGQEVEYEPKGVCDVRRVAAVCVASDVVGPW